ncbi:integral membrane protein-like protein [Westerdykella ornata]|uniref:Integral membrane protein-like protein n=1 Tax=Westerdykella ornata TaxID=318751 RepID=A0A6A6JH41_WESOR|nr:integral membrane protein-like protein [Westerdykella ornata]KAF2275881.1 integral membrane protein-like protein [Westerdykella ornata]
MGKLGRFVCIAAPLLLTLASLICQVLVFMGQLNRNSAIQRDLYFFKANTKDFNPKPLSDIPDIPHTDTDNRLINALQGVSTSASLKDFYQVGLWNYCEGEIDASGKDTIVYCSPRKASYWFNPIEVWEFKDITPDQIYNDEMKKGIDAYSKVAKFAFAAWVIAAILTGVEFIVGIFAVLSRWGSVVTTVVAAAQTIFIIAAAGSSTAIYLTLAGVFRSVLAPYGIKAELGANMFAVVWLAVICSVAAGFFWLISICCCSGKSPHKKVVVEKAPYTYERVASPYLGAQQSGVESHAMAPVGGQGYGGHGAAYEPYREQRV